LNTPAGPSSVKAIKRSTSLPQLSPDGVPTGGKASPAPRWGRLRSLLPSIIGQGVHTPPAASVVTPHVVNITDELITGGLSTLMLQLWFERDERDHRRVPILLHRLKIRISDSLYPMSGHKAVFRVECEYANGAARWVVHRQLRDFISLHTHYTVSNAYNRNQDKLPDFPKTSMCFYLGLSQ
jgi:phospholipase D1/2